MRDDLQLKTTQRQCNYLYELNPDYRMFIEASIDIMKTEALYREKFDKVMSQQEITTHIEGFGKS